MSPSALMLAILVVCASFAGAAAPAVAFEEDHSITLDPPPRASIVIEGNADFLRADSGVRSGSGTSNDPFIISNWSITHTRAAGALIRDTDAHVRLENLVIMGWESSVGARKGCLEEGTLLQICEGGRGIDLFDARNVTIHHVRIHKETWGVRALRSPDLTISDVHIGLPIDAPILPTTIGIQALRGTDLSIDRVNISAITPLFLGAYANAHVTGSRFTEHRWMGSNARSISLSNVTHLTFEQNVLDRIEIAITQTSTDLTFAANEFFGGDHAIWTLPGVGVNDVEICGNRIHGTMSFSGAIALRFANRVHLSHNAIENNVKGFDFLNSADIRVEDNLIANGSERAGQIHADGIEFHGNAVVNSPGGFAFSKPANATLNWWGAASGPGGMAGGDGTPLYWATNPVTFAPWLTSALDLPLTCPDTTPTEPADSAFHMEASTSADFQVEVAASELGLDPVTLRISSGPRTGEIAIP